MFNNYAMDDDEIIESAQQVCSGELVLSLEDLAFLLNNTVDLSLSQKLDAGLIFGIFRKMLSTADLDDENEMECIFDAVSRIQHSDIDDPLHVLNILAETGISFTETLYYAGARTTLRDWLLDRVFSIGIVKKLADFGIDLNEPLLQGRTPAFIVADKEYQPKKRWDKTDKEEEFAEAAAYFSKESMECLNEDGTSAAHSAAKNNHSRMLEVMLRAGVDVNLTEDMPRKEGYTLLHKACRYGNPEIVKLLIEAGADDTIKDLQDETPTHTALFHNYITGSKRLSLDDRIELINALKHIDIPGKCGLTPLMYALIASDYHFRITLVPVFIEKGADVNHVNEFGDTPLLMDGGEDTTKALVKAGADVNVKDQKGDTPLHKALMRGNSIEAQYLIKNGADIHAVNNNQVNPIQIAVEKGFEELFPLMGL